MILVLSNASRRLPMQEVDQKSNPETAAERDEQDSTPSRLAAAVEAAYILEAVRR
jgi:hypothetical protein